MKFFRKKRKVYRLIYGRTSHELEENVQDKLDDGWVCQGGLMFARTKTGGNKYDWDGLIDFYQAMVRDVVDE